MNSCGPGQVTDLAVVVADGYMLRIDILFIVY